MMNETVKRFSDYALEVEQAIKGLSYEMRQPLGLYAPVAYGLEAGGKRLRPVLLLMAANAFGAKVQEAMDAAVGIEMFHNFTLLHDDVMDKSDLRRGRPTVHKKWDENTAILSGDTMLTLATELVTKVPDACLRQVLETFNTMALEVYEGQRLDMDFESRDDVTLAEYMEMIAGKTSALLGASAKIGALIGGADSEDAGRLYDYGIRLGLAFQIQDDYLDVFGDPATFGKPIGGDILNNKKTFLLLAALEAAPAVAEAVRQTVAMPASQQKISIMRNLYEKGDVPERCRETIARLTRESLAALRSSTLGPEKCRPFEALADKLIERRK